MKAILRNHSLRIHLTTAALLNGTAIILAPGAQAQAVQLADSSPMRTEEVIVTAQKRASTVQKTPMSISAVSGDELQDRGITDFATLAGSTPGVSLKSEGPSQTEIEMRGMTSSGGNSADGRFLSGRHSADGARRRPERQGGHQSRPVRPQPDRDLRGPQGTLYGSGSMGGTVRLITNQPDLTAVPRIGQSILSGTEGGGFNHDDNVMVKCRCRTTRWRCASSGSEESYQRLDRPHRRGNPFRCPPRMVGRARRCAGRRRIEKHISGLECRPDLWRARGLLWKPTRATDDHAVDFLPDQPSRTASAPLTAIRAPMAHYQPFDIAEPYSDRIALYSLTAALRVRGFRRDLGHRLLESPSPSRSRTAARISTIRTPARPSPPTTACPIPAITVPPRHRRGHG